MTGGGSPLRYEVRDAIVRIVLDRPEKRNALDSRLVGALREALARAEGEEGARVVTIEGAGKDFCAGADLAELKRITDRGVVANLADVDALAALFLEIRALRLPVIALVQGRALAGGAGLASACDLVIASSDATFGYPEVHIGFVPAMVMAILRRNVPEKRAFELITMGEHFSATDAERWGLVNRVVSAERFEADAAAFAEELAGRSASAVLLAKRLLYNQDGMGFAAAVRAGADVNVLARLTDDTRAGVERFLSRSG